jgi:hypothetical protein
VHDRAETEADLRQVSIPQKRQLHQQPADANRWAPTTVIFWHMTPRHAEPGASISLVDPEARDEQDASHLAS